MGQWVKIWQNLYVRLLFLLLVLVLLYFFVAQTSVVWISFLIAYTLAYIANPLVSALERLRMPRWMGVALTMFLFALLLSVASFVLGRIGLELTGFVETLPETAATVEAIPERIERNLSEEWQPFFRQSFNTLESWLGGQAGRAANWLEANANNLVIGFASVVGGIFQFFITLVLTAYLLYSFPDFSHSFFQLFPPRHRSGLRDVARKLDNVVGSYVRAQLLVAALVGLCVWLGLLILGIPLPLAIGFLAGVGNLVPFLGPVLVSIPALLLAVGEGWGQALGTLVLFLVVNQIDTHVFSPLILSKSNHIHPVTVILAVLLGLSLWGILGALVAVPVAATIKLFYEDYYLASHWYQKNKHEKGLRVK